VSEKPLEAKSEAAELAPATFRAVWSDSEESQRWSLAHDRWSTEIESFEERRSFRGYAVVALLVSIGLLVVGLGWYSGSEIGWW
jgi:hypothetical protein